MLADTKARWGPFRAASLSAATSSDSCAYVRSCRSDVGMTNGRAGTRAARPPILGGRFGDAGSLERAGRIHVRLEEAHLALPDPADVSPSVRDRFACARGAGLDTNHGDDLVTGVDHPFHMAVVKAEDLRVLPEARADL